jgi:ATP-dependent RNA helicase RhlE
VSSLHFHPRRTRGHRHADTRPATPSSALRTGAPRAPDVIPQPITPEIERAIDASPFTALGLSSPLVRAVLEEKYERPSPVQGEVIPHVLAGRDVLACAQTGTGKTAAFVLPLLQLLAASRGAGIRVLILSPTRELAAQIAERVVVYGRFLNVRHALIYGGVSQHRQEVALRAAPEVIVATPGRLLDLIGQRLVRLDNVAHLVLDEADRMLDMGFLPDVRRITQLVPARRQTLLFSATIPSAVEALARGMQTNPARVAIAPAVTTPATVDQSVVFVAKTDKRALLERVLQAGDVQRALVFTRTKHGANRLCEQLGRAGIGSAALHGNKTQSARERALEGFRRGTTRVLVATDVAARGIDVDGISLVVNFDLPNVAESYVHRVGRTGRAGAAGRAISFCEASERGLLGDIERFIRRRLPVAQEGGRPEPIATAREVRPNSATVQR